MIDEPGIYDVPEAEYHADEAISPDFGPSMSSTMAKDILSMPLAKFRHQQDNPVHKKAYDFGSGIHAYTLGVGSEQIVKVDADDWRTKAAQEAKKAAYAANKTPLLASEVDECQKIAGKVHGHTLTGSIFLQGKAEQSLYWRDAEFGLTCRGRVDWLRIGTSLDVIVDLKSTDDAGIDPFKKSAGSYHYHQQAAWYIEGVEAVTGQRLPFLHIAVEKDPPYLVAVYQIPDWQIEVGHERNQQAKAIYVDAMERDEWPGYPEEIQELELPAWALN